MSESYDILFCDLADGLISPLTEKLHKLPKTGLALPTVLITETSGPILRFRMFPSTCRGNNNTNNIRVRPRLFIETYSPLKWL
jgi:hypothetical protein